MKVTKSTLIKFVIVETSTGEEFSINKDGVIGRWNESTSDYDWFDVDKYENSFIQEIRDIGMKLLK